MSKNIAINFEKIVTDDRPQIKRQKINNPIFLKSLLIMLIDRNQGLDKIFHQGSCVQYLGLQKGSGYIRIQIGGGGGGYQKPE